jgi:uncharacterized repeat protein (TIGR01451 family)/fimbrial isopeptide formation D2 family protein
LVAFLAGALILVALTPATALADHAYLPIFNDTTQGDITMTGNTLVTCFQADPKCAAAQAGTASPIDDNNNNNRPVTWVNVVQNDPSIFDSSTAPLVLPSGARVLKAILLYTGRLYKGDDSTYGVGKDPPHPDKRDHVLLRPPGASSFIDLTAKVDDAYDPSNPKVARLYSGEVDVTGIVFAAGSGNYTVANVQIGTGLNADQSGGWSLVVAYEDASMPPRAMTIFEGLRFVLSNGPAVDLPLSGFTTPPAGPVQTNVGMVAVEGDLGITGDSATLNFGRSNAWVMTDANAPADNFFNSAIAGPVPAVNTMRTPNYKNQLGFDIKTIEADTHLANRQTSTTIRLQTNGDGFAPNIVWFSTGVYAPKLSVDKTVAPAGPVAVGQELTYTVNVSHAAGSLDDAANVVLTDNIPYGTTYKPGSLVVASPPNAGRKTDASGDDQAEYDAAGNRVVFRLGNGANATAGGGLLIGQSTSVSFTVRVNADLPTGFQVVNSADVNLTAASTGDKSEVSSPDVVTPVLTPDLTIHKTHTGRYQAGRDVPFMLKVSNVGQAPTLGAVRVTDPLGSGWTLATATPPHGDGWDCSASTSSKLDCTRSDPLPLAPSDSYPLILYTASIPGNVTVDHLLNTATVDAESDGDRTNNSWTDSGTPIADLAVGKRALTPTVEPGHPVRFVVRVTNTGPDTAKDVKLRDFVGPGLTFIKAVPSPPVSCHGSVCSLGDMAPGARVHIRVLAVAGDDTAGKRLVNRVAVSTPTREARYRNNFSRAAVQVTPHVNLQVQKLPAAQTLPAGETVSWTVIVTNQGPSSATHVTLDDALPPGLTLLSATPQPPGTCTGTTCALGTLDAGASTQVVIRASSSTALAGQTLSNTATASASEEETDLDDNTASAQVTFSAPVGPEGGPNVTVTKTSDTKLVNVGGDVTYTITATNPGTATAPSVIVADNPDPDLQVISVTPSQGRCNAAVPIVCDVGPLAPGAHATVVVVAEALAPGVLSNGVVALPAAAPPLNTDVADILALPGPIVRLRKTASVSTVSTGGSVTFDLTATARGAGVARDIEVCDLVPSGFAVVDAHGGRHFGARGWCWTIARLRAGGSHTLQLDVRALATSQPKTLVNVALLTFANRPQRRAIAAVRVLPASRFTG